MEINSALFISLTAFCVVIVVLSSMAFFMHALGWSVGLLQKRTARRLAGPEIADASVEPAVAEDETVAALTAAVSCMMNGSRFRIAEIKPVTNDDSGWISALRGSPTAGQDKWSRK